MPMYIKYTHPVQDGDQEALLEYTVKVVYSLMTHN